MKVNGIVEKIYDKTWTDGGTTYSVRLQGSPLYYRFGKARHAGILEPGNAVEFYADQTDDKSAKVTSKDVTVAKKAAPEATVTAAVSSAPTSGGVKAVDWDAKDAKIQYQSSRNAALQFIELLLTQGAINMPGKQTSKVAFLEALLDKYTAGFFQDIATQGAVARAVPAPAPVEQPKAAEKDVGDEGDDE